MKKLAFISIAIIAMLSLLGIFIWRNFPAICLYAVERMTGSRMECAAITINRSGGIVAVHMRGVTLLHGAIQGSVKDLKFSLNLRRGFSLQRVDISDFNLKVMENTGKRTYAIPPVGHLEATNGKLTLGYRTFFIKECILSDVKTGGPFQFEIDVTNNDLFGNVRAHGEAVFVGKLQQLRGHLQVSRVGMEGWWPGKIAGYVRGEGYFAYDKGALSLSGSFDVSQFKLVIDHLKSPVLSPSLTGNVDISHRGRITDIAVTNLLFKNAPFRITIKLDQFEFAGISLSSDFMPVGEVEEYVDPRIFTAGASEAWDCIEDGKIKIDNLSYMNQNPLELNLRVKGLRVAYRDMLFSNVEALLHLDDKKMEISAMSGVYKESFFRDWVADIPLSGGTISAKGAYSMNLKDIPASLMTTGDVSFQNGTTNGIIELQGIRGGDYRIVGNGSIRDGIVTWKKTPFSLSGSYSITNDGIAFNPMRVKGVDTDVAVKGAWLKDALEVDMKGHIGMALLRNIQTLPIKTDGTVSVDCRIVRNPTGVTLDGKFGMDNASYEIKDFMRKERGIKNDLYIRAVKAGEAFNITRFQYSLDDVDLDVKGNVRKEYIVDLNIEMNVRSFEKTAKLFFIDDYSVNGDATARITLTHVDLRNRNIPYMDGYVRINNGYLKLPWVAKPFKEVSLRADFKGDSFDISIDRFICGSSVLKKGVLSVRNREAPHFLASLDLDNLVLSDFKDDSDFQMQPLDKSTFISRSSGDIALTARRVKLAYLTGEDLEIRGFLADRKLNVSAFKAGTLGGKADMYGSIDLSGRTPHFNATGKVTGIRAGEILNAFNANTEIIDGTGTIYGNLSAAGNNTGEWINNMNGNISIYSEDGVIKKWNLLSKIFGLLNLYDLLKGQVDLTKDGLHYKKMGGRFRAQDGTFKTDNFFIDSPAMFIEGKGAIDLTKRYISAQFTVSPLVGIDTFIQKVPIAKSFFGRKKKGGFLHTSYDVKGPMDNPEISIRFVDTIGGKALDLLKNIVTSPKEVLK